MGSLRKKREREYMEKGEGEKNFFEDLFFSLDNNACKR